MSPESQQPNSENTNAEIAFVQQALAAADRSARFSRIIVVVLGILAVVAFFWMHLHMFQVGKLPRIIAFAASRRSILSRPYFRPHHVRSSGDQSKHPHHPSSACQHPQPLTSPQTKARTALVRAGCTF